MRFPMRNDLIVLILATIVSYPVAWRSRQPWAAAGAQRAPRYVVSSTGCGRRAGGACGRCCGGRHRRDRGTVAFVWWPEPIAGSSSTARPTRPRCSTGSERVGAARQHPPLPAEHLVHLGAFLVVGLGNRQRRAILMGAVLMKLHVRTTWPRWRRRRAGWAVTLLGWQPWAIARVAPSRRWGASRRAADLPGLPSARESSRHHPAGLHRGRDERDPRRLVPQVLLAPTWGRWLRSLLPELEASRGPRSSGRSASGSSPRASSTPPVGAGIFVLRGRGSRLGAAAPAAYLACAGLMALVVTRSRWRAAASRSPVASTPTSRRPSALRRVPRRRPAVAHAVDDRGEPPERVRRPAGDPRPARGRAFPGSRSSSRPSRSSPP